MHVTEKIDIYSNRTVSCLIVLLGLLTVLLESRHTVVCRAAQEAGA